MKGQTTLSKRTSANMFLRRINFDQRVEDDSWTTKELRQIVRSTIHDYFKGKVDEEFVIDVGSAIHHDIFHDDAALISATCIIDDMAFEKFRKKYSSIDQAFREALRFIEEETHFFDKGRS